jgi:hypothetical protein
LHIRRPGALVSNQVTPVVAQFGQRVRVGAGEGVRGRIFGEQAGCEHAVEVRT